MKFFITLALFIVVVWALPHKQMRPIMPHRIAGYSRIIGGSPADLGQFPYQTTVHFQIPEGRYFCGGSLIGADWVLTAGHCANNAISFIIDLGIIDLSTPNVQVGALEAIVHPDFGGASALNDIALIHLDTTVEFNENIKPVRLNTAFIGAGQSAIISGWGKTSDDSGLSQYLNWVVLQTIENAECNSVYGGIDDGQICSISKDPGKNVCNGDSGGPLVIGEGANALHIGIVSFGANAGCEAGLPSGFTRTSFYSDWIKEVTGI